jgi:hypothetical protein
MNMSLPRTISSHAFPGRFAASRNYLWFHGLQASPFELRREASNHLWPVRGTHSFGLSFIMTYNATVAPRTGAWIETDLDGRGVPVQRVAPRTGAWIETVGLKIR